MSPPERLLDKQEQQEETQISSSSVVRQSLLSAVSQVRTHEKSRNSNKFAFLQSALRVPYQMKEDLLTFTLLSVQKRSLWWSLAIQRGKSSTSSSQVELLQRYQRCVQKVCTKGDVPRSPENGNKQHIRLKGLHCEAFADPGIEV
ncbi:MAG: hypothetical protein Q9186_003655 [Xanthomendoza sp. 1 TL-2023]